MNARRGSALILAVIAVLVLTIVGVGLAYLSSTEDRISGNDKLQKSGFYAAEAGLRAGEAMFANSNVSQSQFTSLLGAAGATLDLHDNGYKAVALAGYQNVAVSFTGMRDQPYYSLYIRNNAEDASGDPKKDSDLILNLVSVGWVQLPNGARISKIIEEQISAQNSGTEGQLQKEGNSGGTGGL